MAEQKTYYRRHLPHWQPPEATYHVLFRLAGSLPTKIIKEFRQEREQMEKQLKKTRQAEERKRLLKDIHWKIFGKYEAFLDGDSTGPHWLMEEATAEIVKEAMHYRDGREYDLLTYCIMPNHVHMVFTVGRPVWSSYVGRRESSTYVSDVLENLKWYTALRCNEALGRRGEFWQHESYDHVVRDSEELERIIWYVLNNPVKAGLVKSWEEWGWSYCKPGIL